MAESRHVLVPAASVDLVRRAAPRDLGVHGFRFGARGFRDRLLVRSRLRDPAWSARRRWQVPPDVPLREIVAIWFPPEVTLAPDEADAILHTLPALRVAYWQRTGLDGVPAESFARRGVRIENSRGLTSAWVAEAALACITGQLKDIPAMARGVVRPLSEHTRLFGAAHVAIVGTGRIGREVGRLCTALGMRVTGLSRTPSPEAFADGRTFGTIRQAPTDLLRTAKEADFLVLAAPMTAETRGSVGAQILEALGPEGTLVNLARPGIVEQEALLHALRTRRLGAAYVSRVEAERATTAWRLRRTPNLFVLHDREAHVAEKPARAAEQFLALLAAE